MRRQVPVVLCLWAAVGRGFLQTDEAAFLAAYDELTAESFSAPLSADLVAACVDKGPAVGLEEVVVDGADVLSSSLADVCGPSALCVVEGRVVVDSSWNVGALVVRGEVAWAASGTWLCAGYVAVEGSGALRVEGTGTLYVKNNGATHPVLRSRAVGSVASGGSAPTLSIVGRGVARTWSLLAAPAASGDDWIELLHDAEAMGWAVGDRVAVAPTARLQEGASESFHIVDVDGPRLRLSAALSAPRRAEFEAFDGAANGRFWLCVRGGWVGRDRCDPSPVSDARSTRVRASRRPRSRTVER